MGLATKEGNTALCWNHKTVLIEFVLVRLLFVTLLLFAAGWPQAHDPPASVS